MKFVNPELEVTLFSVEDILTTSVPASEETDAPTEVNQKDSLMEGSCSGTAADNLLDDCL